MIRLAVLGIFSGLILMTSCGGERENADVRPPIEMTSQLYKQIAELIQEEGVDAYNAESGEANFDVYCVHREKKSLNCASALEDGKKDVRIRSFIEGTDTIFFAYIIRE